MDAINSFAFSIIGYRQRMFMSLTAAIKQLQKCFSFYFLFTKFFFARGVFILVLVFVCNEASSMELYDISYGSFARPTFFILHNVIASHVTGKLLTGGSRLMAVSLKWIGFINFSRRLSKTRFRSFVFCTTLKLTFLGPYQAVLL